jgi:hypothetical protein
MMQNLSGQEIDDDAFKAEFDTNPAFKELVDRFDSRGVVLKTKAASSPTGQPGDKAAAQANVMSSAKKAASKLLGK